MNIPNYAGPSLFILTLCTFSVSIMASLHQISTRLQMQNHSSEFIPTSVHRCTSPFQKSWCYCNQDGQGMRRSWCWQGRSRSERSSSGSSQTSAQEEEGQASSSEEYPSYWTPEKHTHKTACIYTKATECKVWTHLRKERLSLSTILK